MKPRLPLPDFRETIEFRELHPTKEGNKIWRFVTTRGIRLRVDGITEQTICYHDKTGKVWARHDRFGVFIEEGYSWNGCSPKYWQWPFGWLGTPDFPCGRKNTAICLGSLFHDMGYQFGCTEHFPLHRSDVDAIFYHTLDMGGAGIIAGIYHGAVDKFASWDGRPKNGEFSTLL